MKRHYSWSLYLTILALIKPAESLQAVEIKQAEDRSVRITSSVYDARIDANGDLAELSVNGARALTHRFGEPGKPPTAAPSINVIAHTVAVRSGAMRVEWTFGDETIGFLTEGYNFECTLDPSVKALVAPGGGGGAVGLYNGGTTAIVLSNNLTVASKTAMHAHERRYLPAAYTSGGVKPGALVENEFRLGAPADAAQTLSSISIKPVGSDLAPLLEGGNQSVYGLVHFSDTNKIAFSFTQQNLGKTALELDYRAQVLDHYVAGKEVATLQRKASLAGEGKSEETWMLPGLPAGFYYLTVSAWRGDTKLVEAKQTFCVALPAYRPPLTRPADFNSYWKKKVADLRAIPFDAVLAEVPEKSTDAAIYYSLELTMAGGKRLKTVLQVPRKPGKYPAQFGGGDKATDAGTVFLQMPIQEVGMMTFNRWTSRDDNNMLDSYLFALRLTDYLRSRPEVDRIYLFGASRTGPVQFVNAALDPTRIAAVDIHVPTSAGIGWTDKPYHAWGVPNGFQPRDPKQVADFTAMAVYFDPVNFAPDMKVPWITAYGVDDTLAHPQGIEAMFQYSPSPWKRISRDGGGHQYSDGFKKLQKELASYLQAGVPSNSNESILKEH